MVGPGLIVGTFKATETPEQLSPQSKSYLNSSGISSPEFSPCQVRLRKIDSETPHRVLRTTRKTEVVSSETKWTLETGTVETPRRSPRLAKFASTPESNSTIECLTPVSKTKRRLNLVDAGTQSKKICTIPEVGFDDQEVRSNISSVSGATDLSLKQTTDYWHENDLQCLEKFEKGTVHSFVKNPTSQLPNDIQHVWNVYRASDKALALIEHFKSVCDARSLLGRCEWPKFKDFLLPNEVDLHQRGEKVQTNCLRGKLFERYKDNEIQKYILLKADLIFETEFSNARSRDAALGIFRNLEAEKLKGKSCENIMQRKKVLNRVFGRINRTFTEKAVAKSCSRSLFKMPSLNKLDAVSQKNLYLRWILSLDGHSDDPIINEIRLQQWTKIEIRDIDAVKGKGIVATTTIEPQEVVCDYHGQYLTLAQDDDENRYFFVLPVHNLLKRKANHTVEELETLTAIDASSCSCVCHPKLAAKGRFINHCHHQKLINVLKTKKNCCFRRARVDSHSL